MLSKPSYEPLLVLGGDMSFTGRPSLLHLFVSRCLLFLAIVFCFLSCQFNLLSKALLIISQVCCPTDTL